MKNRNLLSQSLLLVLPLLVCLSVSGYAAEKAHVAKGSQPQKAAGKEVAPKVELKLEPKAIDILKAASNRLAAARTMGFTAVVSYESPSRFDVPLIYTTKSEVLLQRPDKLQVITTGDGPATEFYYNGKQMTAFAPAENLIAVAEAPPTIDAALKAAYKNAAIYFPFTDVIAPDPYKDIAEGLVLAFYVGQSKVVGGTTTDIVAYANNDVFIQIWIGAEDKLPRMLRAVYRNDPRRLRHQLELSNWQLDPVIPAGAFTATNADKAKSIAFAHPNPIRPPEAKLPKKSTTSQTPGKNQ